MTVLVGSVATFLAVLLGIAGGFAGRTAMERAHAQAAADAVALAAMAESGPHGRADPVGVAGRYAAMNGAELERCACLPGTTAVEVTVRVGRALASARAVFDPEALGPSPPDGLVQALADAVDRLLGASGGRVFMVSGFRSEAEQAILWSEALRRYGDPEAADDWVAPPGASMHNLGLAVDLGGDLDLARRLIDDMDLPLYRPLANEPWHFELSGGPD